MKKTSPITTHSVTVQGAAYHLRRRGSRYNILGPDGRVFTTYQSAGVAGPRWEELTLTAWPQPSTAFAPGSRLRQLRPAAPAVTPPAAGAPQPKTLQPALFSAAAALAALPLALPAPRINLAEHEHLMQRLRRHPPLLFTPRIRLALQHEVEYHRPQALWAAHLLKLLARYDARQRKQQRSHVPNAERILEQHLAWQAGQRATV